ncbi:WD40 repeat-like protein [Suillus weaverae]|nr:WD40 repeat-like protein [Suillus weaverae]
MTPQRTMQGHTGWVRGVVHLPCGQRIITCSTDRSLRLWDLKNGAQIADDWRDEKETAVYTIALSPNGTTVASGSRDGTVRLWDVETGKVIIKWTGHTKVVRPVCWSADGERVVSGSEDGTTRVWDVESSETVLKTETGHDYVYVVMYSSDSTNIATGRGNESAAKIWDALSGELLATLEHDRAVFSLAWTSDGNKLISGSFGPIRIFDTATWQEIAILEGHTDWVNTITLSPINDRILASTSWDNTARLWNLDTNLPVNPPLQHEDDVKCAAFSAHAKQLVVGCNDGNVYEWDILTILKDLGLEDLLAEPARSSLVDANATQLEEDQTAPGFFNDAQSDVRSSAIRGTHFSAYRRRAAPVPSSANPRALLIRFSSLFHYSHSNTDEPTELQQRTISSHHSPRTVKVAAVRDKQALFVARRPEYDKAKQTHQQQQQSRLECQAQASTSHTHPAAASTSATPHAPSTNTTTAGTAVVQPTPIPMWARFVLFICCASPPHANGH